MWFGKLDVALDCNDGVGETPEEAEGIEVWLREREWPCERFDAVNVRPRPWPWESLLCEDACRRLMLREELAPLPASVILASPFPIGRASIGTFMASCFPTQKSQSTHPNTVPTLPQLTTETGEKRSWMMPTKQQTNMATDEMCWTITVESETRGQKS